MALRSILAAMIPRRLLVQYGRRAEVIWRLAAVGLVAAVLSQFGSMAVALTGLVGLLIIWELTGRVASSYGEVEDPSLRQNVQQRMLSFVAGLAASVSFLVLTIVSAGWGVAETDGAIALLVVGSCILAGWLVLNLLRQGWRIGFAILGLTAITVFGSWSVVASVQHPQTVTEPAIVVWVRLLTLFGFVSIIELWANPIGERTKWIPRLMSMAFIIPALSAWLLWLHPPVGQVASFSDIPRIAWFAGTVMGFAVILFLRLAQIIKPGPSIRRLSRIFTDRRSMGSVPLTTTISLAALPTILLATNGSWIQWTIVAGCYALTVMAKVTLHRQMTPSSRRPRRKLNSSFRKGTTIQERKNRQSHESAEMTLISL